MQLCIAQLPSEDVNNLTSMLKERGLLALAVAEDPAETPNKTSKAGPYDNPRTSPREIAKLSNPALTANLARSVHFLEGVVKNNENSGDGSLDETIPGNPEALRDASLPPLKDTIVDNQTPR